jgi:hypothetical protein
MQEQLDWAEKSGYFWTEVESLLHDAFSTGDTSIIQQLLTGMSDFSVMSEFGEQKWKDDLVSRFLKASEGRANWELDRAKENNTSKETAITAKGKEGNAQIWWDKENKVWTDGTNTFTGVGYDVKTGTWKYEGRSDRVQQETERPPDGSGGDKKPVTYRSTKSYEGFSGSATSTTSQ